jgi:hypothetical protein
MTRQQKIIAAISSAVYAYLETEQAALAAQQQAQPQPTPQQAFPVSSPWALAGRQAAMERRYHMQFRTFR